jgi:hypothetical protein
LLFNDHFAVWDFPDAPIDQPFGHSGGVVDADSGVRAVVLPSDERTRIADAFVPHPAELAILTRVQKLEELFLEL